MRSSVQGIAARPAAVGLRVWPRRRMRAAQGAAALLVLGGCTTVTRSPQLPAVDAPIVLAGIVDYEGAPAHLPRSVVQSTRPDLVLRYRYDVTQREDDYPGLFVLLNPFTLLGFPTGTSTANARGRLDISHAGAVVARYDASCSVFQRRTVYSSRNLSALRARALAEVRDAIDAQLKRDSTRPPLLPLVGASRGGA